MQQLCLIKLVVSPLEQLYVVLRQHTLSLSVSLVFSRVNVYISVNIKFHLRRSEHLAQAINMQYEASGDTSMRCELLFEWFKACFNNTHFNRLA